ncbi:hypothetical protein E2320_018175 [Naja naja]|nr:hypothetical protein E2320_018175 [Naja naja]
MTLKKVGEFKVKVDREKVIKCLELLSCLIKIVTQQPANGTVVESLKRKKKGFLPATKKRQNRKKAQPGQSKEDGPESSSRIPAVGEAEGPSEGKKKKRKKRKKKRGGAEEGKKETFEQGPPAKKKAQSLATTKGAAGPHGHVKKKKQQHKGKKKGTD